MVRSLRKRTDRDDKVTESPKESPNPKDKKKQKETGGGKAKLKDPELDIYEEMTVKGRKSANHEDEGNEDKKPPAKGNTRDKDETAEDVSGGSKEDEKATSENLGGHKELDTPTNQRDMSDDMAHATTYDYIETGKYPPTRVYKSMPGILVGKASTFGTQDVEANNDPEEKISTSGC